VNKLVNTDRPRILCVLPGLPDRNTGGGVLLYETLTYLLTRGTLHAVVPVAKHLEKAFAELTAQADLQGIEWHSLRERLSGGISGKLLRLVSPTPAEVMKFATVANHCVLEQARHICGATTELVISSRATAPYPGQAISSNVRLYMMDIDPRIVRYDGPSLKRRITSAIEYPKVDRLCRRSLAAAGRVGAISQADVAELNRMGGRSDVHYVPPLMRPRLTDRSSVDSFHVLITTNFSYPPNIAALEWFLHKCWPHVDRRARLTVTGIDVGDKLAWLCKQNQRVTYAGCLPRNELDALFGRVSLAVNPTRSGSGFQIKLLEAIARGVPIVSTAFSNRLGSAIPSSDDPHSMAELINQRLIPGAVQPFDYAAFHQEATTAWDRFVFGE
jgi:glycosyltransferase involved in cell wall biosynthesis